MPPQRSLYKLVLESVLEAGGEGLTVSEIIVSLFSTLS